MNKRLKHWLIGILIVVGVVCIGIGSAGYYFYNMAVARGKKSFINSSTVVKKNDPLYHEKKRGIKALRSTSGMNSPQPVTSS